MCLFLYTFSGSSSQTQENDSVSNKNSCQGISAISDTEPNPPRKIGAIGQIVPNKRPEIGPPSFPRVEPTSVLTWGLKHFDLTGIRVPRLCPVECPTQNARQCNWRHYKDMGGECLLGPQHPMWSMGCRQSPRRCLGVHLSSYALLSSLTVN